MHARSWLRGLILGALLGLGSDPAAVGAQTVEELKQRIQELERSTREQVEALKRLIEKQEVDREGQRRAEEERDRAYQVLKEQVERQQVIAQAQEDRMEQLLGWSEGFLDLRAGRVQSNDARDPLGREIRGNVYAGDQFKIKLGGSLRLHVQHNDTPVGESVAFALLPNTSVPGGGNNGGRESFRAFAGRTRLNLAVEGPRTLGGKTSGFFEMDFQRQFSAGESGATNNNPRLRHAFGRWIFGGLIAGGDELVLTVGQTGSFADSAPDTVDFNTMLAGLGAVQKRNPRVELVHRYPLVAPVKLVTSVGFERPFFGNDFIGTDLGPGDLSGYPAVSGGIGLEVGRIGSDLGIGASRFYVRTTYGEFEERFNQGTTVANFGTQTSFDERTFSNQAVHGTVILDRIGFNKTGRARTLKLVGGGLWSRGEARHLNAEFDRRVIVDGDGGLAPAQSAGGFANAIFFLTDTLSLRWAGGAQYALNDRRPVATGSLTSGFFRVNNRQTEVSLWWAPGPFTFALAYNHTATVWRRVPGTGGSETRENENNKIELISWFSF